MKKCKNLLIVFLLMPALLFGQAKKQLIETSDR